MSDLIFMAIDSERRAEVGASVIRASVDDAKEAAFRETLVGSASAETNAEPPPSYQQPFESTPFLGIPESLNL